MDRKADVDLHSLLCAEIVELGQRRSKTGVQTDVSSLDRSKRPAENESDSAEHLLRPSALLSGQGLRDWDPPSKSFASRLQASEPVISSYEVQFHPWILDSSVEGYHNRNSSELQLSS